MKDTTNDKRTDICTEASTNNMLSEIDIFTLGFTAAVHTALQTLVTKISFIGVDFALNSMSFTQWCPQRLVILGSAVH